MLSLKKACRSTVGSAPSLDDIDLSDHRKLTASSASSSHQLTMESHTLVHRNESTLLESNDARYDTTVATLIHAANLPINFGKNPLLKTVMFHDRLLTTNMLSGSFVDKQK